MWVWDKRLAVNGIHNLLSTAVYKVAYVDDFVLWYSVRATLSVKEILKTVEVAIWDITAKHDFGGHILQSWYN